MPILLFQVFDKLSQKYYALELDQREDGEEIQDVLKEITGARSVRISGFHFLI